MQAALHGRADCERHLVEKRHVLGLDLHQADKDNRNVIFDW